VTRRYGWVLSRRPIATCVHIGVERKFYELTLIICLITLFNGYFYNQRIVDIGKPAYRNGIGQSCLPAPR
jgi:hypothetical protein